MPDEQITVAGVPPERGISVDLFGGFARFIGAVHPDATLTGVEPQGTFRLTIPEESWRTRPQLSETDWDDIEEIIKRARERGDEEV